MMNNATNQCDFVMVMAIDYNIKALWLCMIERKNTFFNPLFCLLVYLFIHETHDIADKIHQLFANKTPFIWFSIMDIFYSISIYTDVQNNDALHIDCIVSVEIYAQIN